MTSAPALNHILRLSGPNVPIRQDTPGGLRDGFPGAKGEGQTSLWDKFFCNYMSHTGKIPKDWSLCHTKELGCNKIGGCLTHTFLSQTFNCSFPKEKMKLLDFFFIAF